MDPMIAAIIEALADVGGAGIFLIIALRFWPQTSALLTSARSAAARGARMVRDFAARRSVMLARPMWLVIVPTLVVVAAGSSILAAYAPGSTGWFWFAANVLVKIAVIVASIVMAVLAYRVKMVDPTNAAIRRVANVTIAERQRTTNRLFGRAGLFVPMVFTALVSLTGMTLAIVSDAVMSADRVSFYLSMVIATLAVVMGAVTIGFVYLSAVIAKVFINLGIDLAGGGWTGFLLPALARLWPGLTGSNASALLGFTEEEQEVLKQKIRVGLRAAMGLPTGLYAVFGIWFIGFHHLLAIGIELSVVTLLTLCLVACLKLWGDPGRGIYQWVVFTPIIGGAALFFLRLIDAAVPGPSPVMFFERTGNVIGNTTGFIGDVTASGALLLIGFLAVGIVVAVVGKSLDGSLGRALLYGGIALALLAFGSLSVQLVRANRPAHGQVSFASDTPPVTSPSPYEAAIGSSSPTRNPYTH